MFLPFMARRTRPADKRQRQDSNKNGDGVNPIILGSGEYGVLMNTQDVRCVCAVCIARSSLINVTCSVSASKNNYVEVGER